MGGTKYIPIEIKDNLFFTFAKQNLHIMATNYITEKCEKKERELIQKYFGNIVQENLAKSEKI